MNKTQLINYFISQRNASRYLEITVHDEEDNFAKVCCDRKQRCFADFSGEFFLLNQARFDLIFIDGFHTEKDVLQDISYACQTLAPGGMIILHDCMPPTGWHQREPEDFEPGEEWNGTVWKAALRIFNQVRHKCILLDADWGCGIIDTRESQVPKRRDLPDYLDYELHYPYLVEYKVSVSDYFKKQVAVFYHLACMGNWQEVFAEQMLLLKQNGFGLIHLTILGPDNDLQTVHLLCEQWNLNTLVLFHHTDVSFFETPALLAIEAYAREHEGFVLYLHSKGVSNPSDKIKKRWRRLMMRELVENWEACTVNLPVYDIIGTNWRDMPPTSHFSGNFWYASTPYLRTLANFREYYDNPRYPVWDNIYNKRLGCEFWIGSGEKAPRLLSVFCRNVDFYADTRWE